LELATYFAITDAAVNSLLKELESIAKRSVEEETTMFPRLKPAGRVIDIRYAPKLAIPGNTIAKVEQNDLRTSCVII
jgi:hypothetical protein